MEHRTRQTQLTQSPWLQLWDRNIRLEKRDAKELNAIEYTGHSITKKVEARGSMELAGQPTLAASVSLRFSRKP